MTGARRAEALVIAVVAGLLAAALAGPAFAGAAGGWSGVVVDPAGLPVEGARIEVRAASGVALAAAVADSAGRFTLHVAALEAEGAVWLTVARRGFQPWQAAVPLPHPGRAQQPEFTIRLALTAAAAAVTISAEPGSVIDTDSATQSVSLIERGALERPGTIGLSQVAAAAPGLHTLSTSPAMGAFMVRGLTGKNVAVLRDGVRYSTSVQRGGVSTFFNLLAPGSIESVEVLRGPNGAQHGSDAIGGSVVAVSAATPLQQPFGGEGGALYESSAHSFGPSLKTGWGGDRVAAFARLAARRVNTLRPGRGIDGHAAVTRFLGLPSTVFGGRERLPDTGFTSYDGSMHAQARLTGASHLLFHFERGQQDGTKRYDQLLGGDGNLVADVRNLMLDFGYLRWERFAATGPADRISITGSFNAQREERVNQGGQGNPLGAITHQYEKTRVGGVQALAAKRAGRVEVTGGGDAYFERITAPSFQYSPATNRIAIVRPRIPDGARYLLHGVFLQTVWQPRASSNRIRLSGAVRFGGASYRSRANAPLWPADSLAAHAVTGRVGGIVWAAPWLGLHAHASRGFRAPSVTDLAGVGLQGNGAFEAAVADLAGRGATVGDRADDRAASTGRALEGLRPEVANNFDYGVRVRSARVQAALTAFHLSLGNAIVSQTLILPPGAVGQTLGDQVISRQLASGAVFVPASSSPVLARANFSGFRERGLEQSVQVKLTASWRLRTNLTWLSAKDARTGLAPDVEPGLPPLTGNAALLYARKRFWVEASVHAADRQSRLSSLALADRRIGNPRSRASIASFFNNGARVQGLVSPAGLLRATGETLEQVQTRVLGEAASAPQFTALPGYLLVGLAAGVELTENTTLDLGLNNVGDQRHRGIGWGVDGPGRGVAVGLRRRF